MRIYLAGKIASVDWRHLIVRGLTEHLATLDPVRGWPILEGSIGHIHSFTGPFFKKIDKTQEPSSSPVKVHRLCLKAIDESDLVYAWVDDPTCYATIYEMGYAHAKGKYTAVAYPPKFDKSELWFMSACSDEIIEAESPEAGLLGAVMRALKSGKLQNPAAELMRIRKNMARLQQLGEAHDDLGRSARSDGEGDHAGVGRVVLPTENPVDFDDDEPPTRPQDINSKKKRGTYESERPDPRDLDDILADSLNHRGG